MFRITIHDLLLCTIIDGRTKNRKCQYFSNVSNKIHKTEKEKESKILVSYVICKRNTICNTCELIPCINAPFTSVTCIRSQVFQQRIQRKLHFFYTYSYLYILYLKLQNRAMLKKKKDNIRTSQNQILVHAYFQKN